MARSIHLLIFCISIVSVLTIECANGQSSSEPKMRYRRATGGTRHKAPKWLGTFWLDYFRKEDNGLADGKFYGCGIHLGGAYLGGILAEKVQVKQFELRPEEVSYYWDKPTQLVFGTGKDDYVIDNQSGAGTENAHKKRTFWLESALGREVKWTPGWSLLWRMPHNGLPIESLPSPPAPSTGKGWKKEEQDCEFWGWSIAPEDIKTPMPNVRYFVRFPVEVKDFCSDTDDWCTFRVSDGKSGGFCNTFMDAGSPIMCGKPGQMKVLYFITFANLGNTQHKHCNGSSITAFRISHLDVHSGPTSSKPRLVDEPECDESSE